MTTQKASIILAILFFQTFSLAHAEDGHPEPKKHMSKGEMIAIVHSLDEESLLRLVATADAEFENRMAPHDGFPLSKLEDAYLNE